jgi:hypothetical protein
MTDNSSKWKIIDAIYKFAVVALLIIAVVLLNDIRNRQQVLPTMADLKKAGVQDLDLLEMKPEVTDRMPLVRVAGGQVTVDGSVSVDGSVEIEK